MIIIPEDKLKCYLKWCEENTSLVQCDCNSMPVTVKLYPYYYDEENNDVYFASICPNCGKLIITKE